MKPVDSSAASRVQRSRTLRLILAVVVTIPLVASALYMWMMWDPTETVGQMPVALVNEDQPTGEGEARISAGAGVTQNLLITHPLDFRAVDHDTAMKGLNSGDYYFVVEIPKDFSSTLAKIGNSTVAPALITVVYNDNNTLKASSIGAAAMSAINAAVLQGVASSTVGTVLDGVDSLGNGLEQAADGSDKLAQGTGQLSAGLDQLANGINSQLAPGIEQASAGSRQLATGANLLADGLVQFRGGTDQLGTGANQLADGIDKLVTTTNVAALQAMLDKARAQLPPNTSGDPVLDQLSTGLDQMNALVTGLDQLRSGSRQIATQLNDPTASYRDGLNQLVAGGEQLSTGATQLSDGMRLLDDGMRQAASGSRQLQIGSHQVDSGASALSNGLRQGTQAIPSLGDKNQRQTLANLLSTPVASKSEYVAQAQFFGPGGAPALLTISSALVAVVVFMCFRAHRYLTGDNRPRSVRMVARRVGAATAISLISMGVIGLVIWQVLSPSPSPSSLGEVVLIVGAATVMNVAVTSVLFTLFGYAAGALGSLAWMMLQVFSYGGVWMVETLPAPFRWLHPVSPMTYYRDGLIAAFNGAPGFASSLSTMIAIAVAAGVINVLACRKGPNDHSQRPSDDSPASASPAAVWVQPDSVDTTALQAERSVGQ
ncbi:YhgE/Pip domain-containing protein [Nocardia beijingensis]|uniref:YhgE/Pip domain-containing protein n=1 Tax=Nocardia beijingensis TaxID=95162 RepID=UPI00340C514D